MANQQLLEYIKQSLQQGGSQEEIKDALIAHGWQPQDVEEAFNLALTSSTQPPSPSPETLATTTFLIPTALMLDAWALYKKRYRTFVGILLIPFASGLLVLAGFELLSVFTPTEEAIFDGRWWVAFLLMILFAIVGIAIQLWSQVALLYAIKDSPEEIGAKESYRKAWAKMRSYLWVVCLLGFVVLGGFSLLFVPGIIFSIWFSFAIYIVVAEDLGGMSALLKSREYVRGRWLGVFWRSLVIGIFVSSPLIIMMAIANQLASPLISNLLSFIDSLLYLFIALPISAISYFLLYKNVKALRGEFVFAPSPRSKTIFSLIGLLGPLLTIVGIVVVTVFLIRGSLGPDARDVARALDQSTIRTALELYYNKTDSYPSSLDQLAPTYIAEVPTDPKTSSPYEYYSFQDGRDYELCIEFETKLSECVTSSTSFDGASLDKLSTQAYVNKEKGFKIYPPQNWQIDESDNLGIIHVLILNPSLDDANGRTFSANISVASESTSLELGIYVSQSKFLIQKTLKDYKLTEDREVIVGGRLGYIIGGTFTENGVTVRNKQLIVASEGKAYIVTGTALESTWEKYGDLVEASLMTFELL